MPQESVAVRRNKKRTIDSDKLLLVEGRDEVNLFCALIRRCLGDKSDIQVIEAGGKDQFLGRLKAIKIEAQTRMTFQSLGVVRDADDNPKGAFQSVYDHLCKAGYKPPEAHRTFSIASPSVGVFIVPDGIECGSIETLCRRAVEDSDAARCVEKYLKCLAKHNAMESGSRDKSFAHAYLAATSDPVARVGEGAHRDVWDFGSEAFQDLLCFVRDLSLQGE